MADNDTLKIIKIIGSPFVEEIPERIDAKDKDLVRLFEHSFANRVELLFLEAAKRSARLEQFHDQYEYLCRRHDLTLSVMARAAKILNRINSNYVVFKSIKPYPATPNDTDILCLESKKGYWRSLQAFYDNGYIEHEIADLQITICDPEGEGKIGKGKKGGTYYIDFYQDISVDFFVYIDKEQLSNYITSVIIDGVDVKNLKNEPELAIVMFHNVFPETTFHLEHFYLPLYYFADDNFDMDLFVRFVEKNRLTPAVKANLALIQSLHQEAFEFIPEPVVYLMQRWGNDVMEVDNFNESNMQAPYHFTNRIFWISFLTKLKDWTSLRSLGVQGFHMLNPKFAWDVIKILKFRLSGKYGYKHDW